MADENTCHRVCKMPYECCGRVRGSWCAPRDAARRCSSSFVHRLFSRFLVEDELVATMTTAAGREPIEHKAPLPIEVEDGFGCGNLEGIAPHPVHEIVPHGHAPLLPLLGP